MNGFKKTFSLAIQRFHDSNAHDLGAALSYFAVFSIVPLITVLVILTGAFLDKQFIQGQIITAFHTAIGTDATNFLKSSIEQGTDNGANLIASIIGGAVLIYAVINVTTQLQSSLDLIFAGQIKKTPFFKMIRGKVGSFGIVFFLALLLLAFLVISAFVSFFENYFFEFLPFSGVLVQIINLVLTFIFIFGFTIINFKFLPQTKLNWKSILYGATVTSILFVVGKILFTIYLFYANPGSAYGAAGALLVILLWIYYSSEILFFGACFSYAVEKLN